MARPTPTARLDHPPVRLDEAPVQSGPVLRHCPGVRHAGAIEVGLALIFMGRSFTRIYLRKAVARLGVDAAALAQIPASGVLPASVSFMLLSGGLVAAADCR